MMLKEARSKSAYTIGPKQSLLLRSGLGSWARLGQLYSARSSIANSPGELTEQTEASFVNLV